MAKTGEEYEILVKEVYEILNSVDGLDDVKIQHNIKLQGKSRERQIDVYWQFAKAGIPFRVVVECKDYKRPVEAEKIEAFRTALEDLNNPIGIFASKHGFQKGAVDIAKQYGIKLMVIHGPDDEDWDGYIRKIYLNLSVQMITNVRVEVLIDKAWSEENGIEEFTYAGYMDSEVYINHEEKRDSLRDIVNKIPRKDEGKGFKKELTYKEAYIEVGEQRYKIHGINVTYDIVFAHDTIMFDAGKLIKAFVKDVIDEETKVVDIRGGVRYQGKVDKV